MLLQRCDKWCCDGSGSIVLITQSVFIARWNLGGRTGEWGVFMVPTRESVDSSSDTDSILLEILAKLSE